MKTEKKTVSRVLMLQGGISEEREISLSTAKSCKEALKKNNFKVKSINIAAKNISSLGQLLLDWSPDVVFNALHGGFGEDGTIQGLLETMKIPYTHSGVLSSAIAMNKFLSKKIFKAVNLPVIDDFLLDLNCGPFKCPIPPPFVIKPNNGGSSVGIQFIREEGEFEKLQIFNSSNIKSFLLEKYVPGRELTVAVLNGQPLTVTDIITKDWYDYDAKYIIGGSKHVIPADIPSDIFELCMKYAVSAHNALGCRGISRSDFRWNEKMGKSGLFILELNTQPGMTVTSLVPEQAKHIGLDLSDLCLELIKDASCNK